MRRYPPPKASRWRDENGNRTGGKPGWARLRKQALDRDGHQCTRIDPAIGQRCTATTRLEVHHLYPGTEQIVPLEQLATVCHDHNPRGAYS